MEIQNTTFFLSGIIVLVLGMFVMVFDYPQIQYFERMPPETYFMLDWEEKDIHNRLLIETSIGAAIILAGVGMIVFSLVKRRA